MSISETDRAEHLRWLAELTAIPTAAGREWRVVRWIEQWAGARPGVALEKDPAGNLVLTLDAAGRGERGRRPVYFTAHLDHPAFVVRRIVAPSVVEVGFRGGVMDDYFPEAGVLIHPGDGPAAARGVIAERTSPEGVKGVEEKHFLVELEADAELGVGDVGTWELPAPAMEGDLYHTNACDDLAAAASALGALDVLRRMGEGGERVPDVRLLFTRAEEVGFIGAIAACRHGTIPDDARVIALENSRSFEDSPIGGGPIVRVGDRLSIFSPELTAAVASVAEKLGGPALPRASEKHADVKSGWRWQRKLMPGGACEATVFCSHGHEATCLCLPLGNYHNMADLSAVQAGTNTARPRVGREYISVSDFHALTDLLVACGESLPASSPISERIEKLWGERRWVLD